MNERGDKNDRSGVVTAVGIAFVVIMIAWAAFLENYVFASRFGSANRLKYGLMLLAIAAAVVGGYFLLKKPEERRRKLRENSRWNWQRTNRMIRNETDRGKRRPIIRNNNY